MKTIRVMALSAAFALLLSAAVSTASPRPGVMTGGKAGKSPASQPATATQPAAPKVDINSAAKPDLVKLPGIGDAIADKIIAGRPWKKIDQLVSKKVLTASVYAKIKGLITAVQPK